MGRTNHSKFTSDFVGEVAKGEHADDGTSKGDRADRLAVVVGGNAVGTIDLL